MDVDFIENRENYYQVYLTAPVYLWMNLSYLSSLFTHEILSPIIIQSLAMALFMLTLKTAFPQFVNILMWLSDSDSLMIAWRQHIQCKLYSSVSSTRTINYRSVVPLAPFWILKINSMKEQKITDCGFTQMRFLGDGLIDPRKDESNKKTFSLPDSWDWKSVI